MRTLLTTLLATILTLTLTPAQASETTVYYRLHRISASDWSAHEVMRDWSASPLLNARLTDTCVGHSPCIHVWPLNLAGDVAGEARWYNNRWTIIVDVAEASSPGLKQAVLCHEVGHTLGLGHVAHGCMRAVVGPTNIHPSAWSVAHAYPPTYSTGITAPQHEDRHR